MKEKLIYAYKDKLTTFYKNIGEEFSNHSEFLSYITGIHIPGFGSEYPTAKRKILYMGIDTKGWDNIQKELERLNSSDYIEKAILYSCEELENFNFWRWFKPIKKNGNIGTSPFWNAVIKIHLAIKNISPSDSIKYGDKSKYENELNDFAWGNTHSIETYLHSNSKNEENSLDFNSYKKIQNLTKPFDDLEFIINTFTPDLVIIMNGDSWETDTWKNYFSKLELVEKEKQVNCWKFKSTSGVLVYWLNHPRAKNFGNHGGILEYFKKEFP